MLPTATQGRKVIWDAIDRQGRRVIDQAFPAAIRANVNKNEMKIELKCGSIWQVVGSDNYNALIGANPIGVVFSEYSVADPQAWEYLRPILTENGGWAIFIYTPRGKNHGYDLYQIALANPDWYSELLTIRDTGIISEAAVQEERLSGMSKDMIEQEFYCSFEAGLVGSYYSDELSKARDDKRLTNIPYQSGSPVYTAWDLGFTDSTAIWFVQAVGQELHWIDYYESSGEPLSHYVKVVKEKPYIYADHIAPHDIGVSELGTGKSRLEVAKELGIRFVVAPKLGVMDGVDALRRLLPQSWIDPIKCKRGLESLWNYRKEWDDRRKEFKPTPLHDWASHAADAARYFAVGFKKGGAALKLEPINYPKVKWV